MKQIGVVIVSMVIGAALAVLVLDHDNQRTGLGVEFVAPSLVAPVDGARSPLATAALGNAPARVSVEIPLDTPSTSGEAQPTPEADTASRISDVELEAIVRTQEPFAADDSTFDKKYASMAVEDLEIAFKLVKRFMSEEIDLDLPSVLASGDYSTPPERNGGPTFYKSATAPDGQRVKVYFDHLEYPFLEMRARENGWLIMRIRELGSDPGRYNTSRTKG